MPLDHRMICGRRAKFRKKGPPVSMRRQIALPGSCVFTSQLPEYYRPQIKRIDGVTSVLPMKVVVSNCRASLDVVTFRGVPREGGIETVVSDGQLLTGSISRCWPRQKRRTTGLNTTGRSHKAIGQVV